MLRVVWSLVENGRTLRAYGSCAAHGLDPYADALRAADAIERALIAHFEAAAPFAGPAPTSRGDAVAVVRP